MKVEDGLNQASQLILQYHVSLSDPYDFKSLAPPNGSGTFVKFSVRNRTILGILTAAHIARWLKFTFNDSFLLGAKDAGVCISLKIGIDTPIVSWAAKFFRYLLALSNK